MAHNLSQTFKNQLYLVYTNKHDIMKKGLSIEVTSAQYEFLHEVLMEAYSNDVAEQKDWDVQTFDNLIDNVCNAKETYLSNSVIGA